VNDALPGYHEEIDTEVSLPGNASLSPEQLATQALGAYQQLLSLQAASGMLGARIVGLIPPAAGVAGVAGAEYAYDQATIAYAMGQRAAAITAQGEEWIYRREDECLDVDEPPVDCGGWPHYSGDPDYPGDGDSGGGDDSDTSMHGLVDPSGTVLDTNGNPVGDATVTILRGATSIGPSTPRVSSARVRVALSGEIVPHGKLATLGEIIKNKGFAVSAVFVLRR
jgi:hypothetical protein